MSIQCDGQGAARPAIVTVPAGVAIAGTFIGSASSRGTQPRCTTTALPSGRRSGVIT